MNIKVSSTIPTKPGWYYWVNDILCPQGAFVEVYEVHWGDLYFNYHDGHNVKTFQRSKWSEKFEFTVDID